MNDVKLSGRFSKEVELKNGTSGKPFALCSIAVEREYKNKDGKYDADFLDFICFGRTAEYLAKYGFKGQKAIVHAKLRNRSFEDKTGNRRQVMELVSDNVELLEYSKEGKAAEKDPVVKENAKPSTKSESAPEESNLEDLYGSLDVGEFFDAGEMSF